MNASAAVWRGDNVVERGRAAVSSLCDIFMILRRGPRALPLFLSPSLAFRSQGEAFCERCRLQLEEKVLGLCLPLCLQQLHPLEHPADELLLLLDAQGVGLQRPLQLRIRI